LRNEECPRGRSVPGGRLVVKQATGAVLGRCSKFAKPPSSSPPEVCLGFLQSSRMAVSTQLMNKVQPTARNTRPMTRGGLLVSGGQGELAPSRPTAKPAVHAQDTFRHSFDAGFVWNGLRRTQWARASLYSLPYLHTLQQAQHCFWERTGLPHWWCLRASGWLAHACCRHFRRFASISKRTSNLRAT